MDNNNDEYKLFDIEKIEKLEVDYQILCVNLMLQMILLEKSGFSERII